MEIELKRTTLELAIAALKNAAVNSHRQAAAERQHERSMALRAQADQADAAAEEIRFALHGAGRG